MWDKRECRDWLRLAGFGGEVAEEEGAGDEPPGGGDGGGGGGGGSGERSSGSGAGGGPASEADSGAQRPGDGGAGGGAAGGSAAGGGLRGGGPKRAPAQGRRVQTRGVTRQQEEREREAKAQEEERRRLEGKFVMAGDDVRVNVALDDVHVSDPDNALPAWLLDAGDRRAAGRCAARVWHSDRAQRVLGQCRSRCKGDGEFCGLHAAPEKRPFGVWDPEK